jgi:hypothetical protein
LPVYAVDANGTVPLSALPKEEYAAYTIRPKINRLLPDGRDPNSYAGILWCFGKHDRPWFDREIFGTLRYMTSQSMAKKFNARRYIGVGVKFSHANAQRRKVNPSMRGSALRLCARKNLPSIIGIE